MIRAETDKERTIILAKAYEESETRRGEGDAEATRIYAKVTGRSRILHFPAQARSIREDHGEQNMVVLSTDSWLFEYLIRRRRATDATDVNARLLRYPAGRSGADPRSSRLRTVASPGNGIRH